MAFECASGSKLSACGSKDVAIKSLGNMMAIKHRSALNECLEALHHEEREAFLASATARVKCRGKALYETISVWSHPTKSLRNKKLALELPGVVTRTMRSDIDPLCPTGIAFHGLKLLRGQEKSKAPHSGEVNKLTACDALDSCHLRVLGRKQMQVTARNLDAALEHELEGIGLADLRRRGDGSLREDIRSLIVLRDGVSTEVDIEIVEVLRIPEEISARYTWPFVGAVAAEVRSQIRSLDASGAHGELESAFGSAQVHTRATEMAAFIKRYLRPRLMCDVIIDTVLYHFRPDVPWHKWRPSAATIHCDAAPKTEKSMQTATEGRIDSGLVGSVVEAESELEELSAYTAMSMRYAREDMLLATTIDGRQNVEFDGNSDEEDDLQMLLDGLLS
jgi:hypothetical protein